MPAPTPIVPANCATFQRLDHAAPYATRVASVTAEAGVGSTGASFNVNTTQDDTSIDKVNGGGLTDLFFANQQGGTAIDKVSGRKATDETLVDLA